MLKFKLPNPFILYLIMSALGIIAGISGIELLQSLGQVISDIFIKIFKCISTPIIALSIIVTLAGFNEDTAMKKLLRRTTTYTIGTTIVAASVSCLLYILIHPSNVQKAVTNTDLSVASQVSYTQYLASLIPSNIFTPFLEHQVIGVLIIGMLIGFSIRYIPDQAAKATITCFFKGVHGVFFVITKWIVAILPIGLFGFITTTVIQMREGMSITGIGEYLSVVVLANVIQGVVILPIWLKYHGVNPYVTMKKMMPALSIAFFSKSSAGTLPITMATAEKNLNIQPKISRFVLPLCTSLNMNGCAAFIFATVIYLMQNHGIDITPLTLISWIFIATIAALGNAGVPMGCFFLSASLLSSMNVPILLMGIILPFYSVIDMIETSLNVWSDSCVTKIVDEQERKDQKRSLAIHPQPAPLVDTN